MVTATKVKKKSANIDSNGVEGTGDGIAGVAVARDSLVCGMKDSKDLVTKRRGYDDTVTVGLQDGPVYVERVTICPECWNIIVRGTAMVGSDAVSVACSPDMTMMY